MEMRDFGRSGIRVSLLGFGCGAVGGLMVRGDPADQERTIARALEAGVNYFDTAVQYGEGASERNLGRVLKKLKPADAVVGTKVRLQATDANRIENAIRQSLDIFYLHNPITLAGGGDTLSKRQVVEEVAPAFDRLRREGKIRIPGFTAIGDTEVLGAITDSGMFAAAQVTYNMLNPSAAGELPAGYPAQDYSRLLDRTQAAGVGVVGIRVLAGGALSGSAERHPIASPPPEPIGSALTYAADLARARRLRPLLDEGYAGSLPEAAIRFAMSHPAISTLLVGMAVEEEFEQALAAVRRGPLPPEALDRLAALQQTFVGEAR